MQNKINWIKEQISELSFREDFEGFMISTLTLICLVEAFLIVVLFAVLVFWK